MYILSEYEQMKNKHERYAELYSQLEKEVNGLLELAKSLHIPWEGAANRAYIIRFKADAIMLSLILKRLNSADMYLVAAISKYQQNEVEVAGLIDEI